MLAHRFAVLTAALALTACTVVNSAKLHTAGPGSKVFLTAGGAPGPSESLGVVQCKRAGLLLFGFLDPVGTDLDSGFARCLVPEVEKMGGDGAVNVRFHQTQYLPMTKVIFAILFVLPLPTEVTVSGEVVKLRR